MRRQLSRRTLIGGGGLAIRVMTAGGDPLPAAAEEEISEADKITRTYAHYQRFPNGPQRCQICLQFTPRDKCKIV